MQHWNKLILMAMALIFLQCQSSDKQSTDQSADSSEGKSRKSPGLKTDLPLDEIKLPKGFEISVFAKVENARSLALSDKGTVFVGNRAKDKVYAIRDEDGDFAADKVYVIAEGLTMPNGVAFKDGALYVAEVNRILKFDNIDENLENPPKPEVIYDEFPTEKHHGWKFIAFGPDDKLYVPVGAPCNICESEDEVFASITRMNPDGSELEVFSHGVRNSVGFDWHPESKALWFTNNGRDMMGDDIPDDELNRAPEKDLHFGYPYCHAGDVKDPEFGEKRPCEDFTPPAYKLGAHVAAIGMRFYKGDMFPDSYQNQILIAKHGSWNRTEKSGYQLTKVTVVDGKATGEEIFAEGWLNEATQEVWGRPADVQELADGSLLVSDDFADVIYRISYREELAKK